MSRRKAKQAADEPGAAESSEAPELEAEAETGAAPPAVPEPAAELEPAAGRVTRVAPAGPPGRVYCEAIRTVLTPGEPTFAGAKFWLDAEAAERLRARGDLRIL